MPSGLCRIPSLDNITIKWAISVVCPQCGADASLGSHADTGNAVVSCQSCRSRRDIPVPLSDVKTQIFTQLAQGQISE